MTVVVSSAPGKIILFGEHGVQRHIPNITTAVDMRTFCRVMTRNDGGYSLRSGDRHETGDRERLRAFKAEIDDLRAAEKLLEINAKATDFFAPSRYVLASIYDRIAAPGVDVEWHSELPIGSGLGSGAAASTSMTLGVYATAGLTPDPADVIYMSWQGDIIAHGGVGSSMDSSTIMLGGAIRYLLPNDATPLPFTVSLPLVIGDTLVAHSTGEINTNIRLWLEAHPSRLHIFHDMGYLFEHFLKLLEARDLPAIGHLMNVHQLLQEKMGTSCPEIETLLEASIGAGALGAKISGSGGGGIIIALAEEDRQADVAAAIDAAGGHSYIVTAGVDGARIEPSDAWT
jgi:mevalonate kinase